MEVTSSMKKYKMPKFSFLIGILLWQGMILSTQATERVALIIGNGQYQISRISLDNPVNDARDIAQALKSLGFRVIHKENATKRTMQQAISEFARRLRKNSIGVFYYAGHGAQSAGENYLLPVDFRGNSENDYERQAIMANQILVNMKATGSSTNIVILDACRDNPLAQSTATRSFTRSGARSGLATMPEVSGSYIAFSTSPGKVAYDGDGRNSPYARNLIQFIKEPMPIEIMFKRVRTAVMQETQGKDNGTQVPWESSSLVGTDFCFVDGCGQIMTGYQNNAARMKTCKMKWGRGEYQGQCKNRRPEGYGVQRYPSGEYYKGAFRNGVRHGRGTQYLPDGFEISTYWENGRPK